MSTNNEDRAQAPKIKTPCPSCGNQTLFVPEHGLLTCSVIGCKAPAMLNDMAMERRKQMEDPPPAPWVPKVKESVLVVGNDRAPWPASVVEIRGEEAAVSFSGGMPRWYAFRDLRPAPPAEPWTPKKGDEVKIIASTYGPCHETRALIGSTGAVTDCGVSLGSKQIFKVFGFFFHASDLELVRGAEDAAS